MSKAGEYLRSAAALLERAEREETAALEAAADLMANAILGGGLVHFYGTGHSMLPALEIFPRYGSYVGLHPLVDPRTLWVNVLGSGGVPEGLFLQNTEGYADVFLDGQSLREGDVLVVFSHGGKSAAVVDGAYFARARGLKTVAILSRDAAGGASRHSSGDTLLGLADVVVDTGVPRGEGLVEVEGLRERVGAGSTVVATALGLALVAACAERLVAAGHPVVQSVREEHDEVRAYRAVYDAYETSLRRPDRG